MLYCFLSLSILIRLPPLHHLCWLTYICGNLLLSSLPPPFCFSWDTWDMSETLAVSPSNCCFSLAVLQRLSSFVTEPTSLLHSGFPDECFFVSCVCASLSTPCYRRPGVVSPPNPLTRHAVHTSIQSAGQLPIISSLPSSSHTAMTWFFSSKEPLLGFRLLFFPREAICVATKLFEKMWNSDVRPPAALYLHLDKNKVQERKKVTQRKSSVLWNEADFMPFKTSHI